MIALDPTATRREPRPEGWAYAPGSSSILIPKRVIVESDSPMKKSRFNINLSRPVTCQYCGQELSAQGGKLPKHFKRGTARIGYPNTPTGIDCPGGGKVAGKTTGYTGTRE